MDWCQNGSFKSTDALCTDEEELDLKKVDKPRPIERCKSCDVRSLSELSKISENSSYSIGYLDKTVSLQPKSGMNIPESLVLDPHSHPTVRPHIAKRALEIAETKLLKDNWPEYYDGKLGRYIGKQARKCQTWSIAGYLVALEDDKHLMRAPRRSNSYTRIKRRTSTFQVL